MSSRSSHPRSSLGPLVYVLDQHRGAARVENEKGHTPLHYALCNDDPDPEVLAALLPEDEEFAARPWKLAGGAEQLPLHAYLVHFMKPDIREGMPRTPSRKIVEVLVEFYEEVLWDVRFFPNRTPLEIVKRLEKVNPDVVEILEGGDWDVEDEGDERGLDRYEYKSIGEGGGWREFGEVESKAIRDMIRAGLSQCKVGENAAVVMDRKNGVREYGRMTEAGKKLVRSVVRRARPGRGPNNALHDALQAVVESPFDEVSREPLWNEVISACERNPSSATCVCQFGYLKGCTPLDMALYAGSTPLPVVTALLSACSSSPSVPDSSGCYPLHTAVYKRSGLEVVRTLRERYPEAERKGDRRGWTPLHYACGHGKADPDVLGYLLGYYPEGLKVGDKQGRTPLYWAVEYQVSMDTGGEGRDVGDGLRRVRRGALADPPSRRARTTYCS